MHSNRKRVTVAALALVASAVAVTGCSAGQITQTATQIAAVNGESAEAGPLRISNATLAYPEGGYWAAGSDVPLTMSISNNGGKDDVLQLVSTTASKEPTIEGDKVVVSRRTLTVGELTPVPSTGEPDAAADDGDVGKASIVLTGITTNLYPGMVVRLTLTFRDAGTVKLRVPIAAPDHPRAEEPEAGHEGGEH